MNILFFPLILLLLFTSLTTSTPLAAKRAFDCFVGDKPGQCLFRLPGSCPDGTFTQGHCPNSPVDVQCCVKNGQPSQRMICDVGGIGGTCGSVKKGECPHGSRFTPGRCPGGKDNQCCTKIYYCEVASPHKAGVCGSVAAGQCGGNWTPGLCPGNYDIKCCTG